MASRSLEGLLGLVEQKLAELPETEGVMLNRDFLLDIREALGGEAVKPAWVDDPVEPPCHLDVSKSLRLRVYPHTRSYDAKPFWCWDAYNPNTDEVVFDSRDAQPDRERIKILAKQWARRKGYLKR